MHTRAPMQRHSRSRGQSLVEAAITLPIVLLLALSVTFHCLNGAAITNATGNGGPPTDPGSDSITATITKQMTVITPVLWPLTGGSYPLRITSSQRVEY